MRKRNNRVEIYLTDSELKDLSSKVKKAGMTRERFLRKVIAECRVFEAPPVDFFTLLRAVKRLGSNIEQILKRLNSSGFVDTARLTKAMDELDEMEHVMKNAFAPDGR